MSRTDGRTHPNCRKTSFLTRVTTFIKEKFMKSDYQSNITVTATASEQVKSLW